MYISLNDILFLLILLAFLIMVYRRIIYSISSFEPIIRTFKTFDRKHRINAYIKQINQRPAESQKVLFKELFTFTIALIIMYLFASKAIFFTAVVSGSMSPTFNKDDLVLMQNIDRTYKSADIIMFERPDTSYPIVHRISLITDKGINTAGDATGQMDWWELQKKDILGKAILIQGKPVVIKGYGKFFIVDDTHQDFGPLGQDYAKYFLFFQVLKIYGYVIAVFSLFLYIIMTFKQKPWQSR
ncbi:Peptidase S24-like protein [uncultured archaeon]|nr:Peptidase S24-like protein [uncultured archaeon]